MRPGDFERGDRASHSQRSSHRSLLESAPSFRFGTGSAAVALIAAAALWTGCIDPYERRQGEYYAGPVDPVNFPPEYLGTGGNRLRAGSGVFTASAALASTGAQAEYFQFSFTPAQLVLTDKLRLLDDGQANRPTTIPTSIAYVFDPTDTSAFPASSRCVFPPNYSYDRQRDAVRYDEQGNIFTALPSASYDDSGATTTYVPIVAQVPVSSMGEPCQEIKSEKTLLGRTDVALAKQTGPNNRQTGMPDGKFLAWAVIDPGAAVYHAHGAAIPGVRTGNPPGGVDLQKFGWFNHYLLAYFDGGYVPTEAATTGNPPRTVTRMLTQDIYYPRSPVIHPGSIGPAPGRLGRGYDLLQFKRGEAGYSPVCRVVTYDAGDSKAPADLPQSVTGMLELYGDTLGPPEQPPAPEAAIPSFIYCLQLQ